MHAQAAAPIVYHFAALAQECPDPEVAFHLSDFCNHLTNATTNLVHVFKRAAIVLADGGGKAALTIADRNIKFAQHILTDPKAALKQEYIDPYVDAGIALGKAVHLAVNNPRQFGDKVIDLAEKIATTAYDKPEEVVSLAAQILLGRGVSKLTGFLKNASIVNAIKKEAQLAVAIAGTTSSIGKRIATPIASLTDELKKCTIFSFELKKGSGNFTFNIHATKDQAKNFGEGWLGKGYRAMSSGEGLTNTITTPDYILQRTFRFPDIKKNGRHKGKLIANFEERIKPIISKEWQQLKDGHLIINE